MIRIQKPSVYLYKGFIFLALFLVTIQLSCNSPSNKPKRYPRDVRIEKLGLMLLETPTGKGTAGAFKFTVLDQNGNRFTKKAGGRLTENVQVFSLTINGVENAAFKELLQKSFDVNAADFANSPLLEGGFFGDATGFIVPTVLKNSTVQMEGGKDFYLNGFLILKMKFIFRKTAGLERPELIFIGEDKTRDPLPPNDPPP